MKKYIVNVDRGVDLGSTHYELHSEIDVESPKEVESLVKKGHLLPVAEKPSESEPKK